MFVHEGIRYFLDANSGEVKSARDGEDAWLPALETATEYAARAAMISAQRAMSYAWGRQDQVGAPDSAAAARFAEAWAAHAFKFHTHTAYAMRNMRDGYEQFLKDGRIEF